MKRYAALLAALLLVAGCTGSSSKDNPFQADPEADTGTETGGEPVDPIDGDRSLPPGTAQPTASSSIVRREADNSDGGGFASNISYDAATDEFHVDNIAFDGDNSYSRGTSVSSLGGPGAVGAFSVYEVDAITNDPDTGFNVGTLPYRAIYGRSTSGRTEFAIVRTGGYQTYGFGGFVYQRNAQGFGGESGGVVLPEQGSGFYEGPYAGMRVFDGRSGLEYVTGRAEMTIDFQDFNNGDRGVMLFVYDRRLFDINGNDITADYLTALDETDDNLTLVTATHTNGRTPTPGTYLPELRPVVSPDDADENGEITGDQYSQIVWNDGTQSDLAQGKYYAIMSGEDADEVVGVIVTTENDPRTRGVTVQETGGFTIYRQ